MTFWNVNGSRSGMEQSSSAGWAVARRFGGIRRGEESVLGRIQIGHAHLTHSLVWKGETLLNLKPVTVDWLSNILLDYIDLIESRDRRFDKNWFKELSEKISLNSI